MEGKARKMLELNQLMNVAVVSLNRKTGTFENAVGMDIFPEWLQENGTPLLQTLYDERDRLSSKEKQLYELVYTRIITGTFIEARPTIFMLHLPDDSRQIPYKFVLHTVDDEITAYIYKEPYILEDEINPVSMYGTFEQFETRVTKLIKQKPFNKKAVLMQVDIDAFSTLNDKFGEQYCDMLLRHIGDSLCIFLRNSFGVLYRTADVFTFYYECPDETTLLSRLQFWNNCLQGFGGKPYRLVWGIYYIPDSEEFIVREGVDKVTTARKSVKSEALNNIGIYTEGQEQEYNYKKSLESVMHQALDANEFCIYIQPKHSLTTGKIVGGESLVRWIPEKSKVVAPSEFIALFEENRFILLLDRFVWRSTCELLYKWRREGRPIVPLSVNISRRHLFDNSFIDYIDSLIDTYALDKSWLQLEITETYDDTIKAEFVKEIRKRGYTLLMDDFGSGYSSLNALCSTDFDIVKLDRGFLCRFCEGEKGQNILKHTIALLKSVGVGIVAEGVETEEQAEFLKNNGCDVAQGFLFSRPMPVNEFEEKMME